MTSLQDAYEAAVNTLTQPGSPFETGRIDIGGVNTLAYVNAPDTLVQLLSPGRQFGDEEFLVYQDQRYTFTEFFKQSDLLARQLTSQFGIRKGQRVAIAMRNYPEWLVSFVAIAATGAVVVPLNSWGQGQELRLNITDARACLVICDQHRLQLIDPAALGLPAIVVRPEKPLPHNCISFDQLLNANTGSKTPAELTVVDTAADDPAMILFTSGTSGRAKGALFSHRSCCQAIINLEAVGAIAYLLNPDAFIQHGQLGAVAKSLLTVPLFHVAGLYSQFLLSLRNGRCMVMMHKWDPVIACQLIDSEKITVVVAAPSMLLDLIQREEFATADTSKLINVSGGGAATPTRLADLIAEKIPNALPGAGWGMTESGSAGTAFTGYPVKEKPGASGFVSPIVELRLCDEQGQDVAHELPGEIWIKSPTLISGYINAPDANNSDFKDGWFKTGDIGYLDSDGCMYICDRVKDLVIRGGENIYPVEIENCIQSVDGVQRVAAFAVPSDRLGEELAVVISCKPTDLAKLTVEMVQQHCRERLAMYKIPSFLKFTTADLPTNATGKILKRKVKDIYFPSVKQEYS